MRRPCLGSARSGAGFSLLELLVSMALVLLALALGAQLLLESQRTFALSGRAAREPLAGYAQAQLTADARNASGVAAGPGGVLLLTGNRVGTLRWERRGDELLRTVLDPTGKVLSRRPVLRRVTGWSWAWSGELLTATFVYRRGATLRYVVTPGLPPETVRQEAVAVQVHPRGKARWNRW